MTDPIFDAKETLNYYRDAADVAERKARAADDPDIRAAYIGIRQTWTYLAEKLEQDMALAGNHVSLDAPDDLFVPSGRNQPTHKAR